MQRKQPLGTGMIQQYNLGVLDSFMALQYVPRTLDVYISLLNIGPVGACRTVNPLLHVHLRSRHHDHG